MKLLFKKNKFRLRNLIGHRVLKGRFPYAYARYFYWSNTGLELDYQKPKDFNQKLFWLARYWQNPLIVRYTDKLLVREYVRDCGYENILNTIYKVYENELEFDLSKLPNRFVLKANNGGGGTMIYICKDKNVEKETDIRERIASWLCVTIGLESAEYQYQYIKPLIFAEKYIGNKNDERLEIQFFCFNGKAQHVLVRNDLGDKAKKSFAISYNMKWERSADRKEENIYIDIPKPNQFQEMVQIVQKLAEPFPQVRVDLYYVDNSIIFGEMTFSTSGNILSNYKQETIERWGKELILPNKLSTRWSSIYKNYKK